MALGLHKLRRRLALPAALVAPVVMLTAVQGALTIKPMLWWTVVLSRCVIPYLVHLAAVTALAP